MEDIITNEQLENEENADVIENVCDKEERITDEEVKDAIVVFTSDNSTNERIAAFKSFTKNVFSEQFVDILINMNYFTAPASTTHGNYKGGLFDHSFLVAQLLCDFTIKNNISWQLDRSPLLIGLMHDICRCDDYTFADGRIVWNEDQFITGHGDKSLMILSQFMTLTAEEVMCIRYHMGAHEDKDWSSLDKVSKTFCTVLWTQLADQLASKCYNC